MRVFYTPSKNWLTIAFLVLGIVASPFVVAAHFMIRDVRGDYGIADAIMIPIASYFILAFPFALLFLVFGLRRYAPAVFIFAWSRRRFWRSLVWTVLLFMPASWTGYMFLDGIDGRLYWVAAFFAFYFYCLLVLRACLVSYDTKMQPNKSPEPTAVGAVSSAIAVHATSRRWLSFLR
jgi:hypothetical protein